MHHNLHSKISIHHAPLSIIIIVPETFPADQSHALPDPYSWWRILRWRRKEPYHWRPYKLPYGRAMSRYRRARKDPGFAAGAQDFQGWSLRRWRAQPAMS